MWWCMSVLGRLRQEDHEVKDKLDYRVRFESSLSYTARLFQQQ